MENLSKALMITGGILIAIMVISLIVVLWKQMSGYYTEQHNATIIEQTAEFNAQFENYNGKEIRGNELVSIMNKIINYNHTESDMQNYERVKIQIDLKGHAGEFAYDGSANLFPSDPIHNNTNDTEIKRISELSVTLTSSASGIPGITDAKLQKLSADIDNIVNADKYNGDEKKAYIITRTQKLKSILGYTVESTDIILMNNIIDATKQYYQYTQFKRAMFECTGIEHNTTNGRVNRITFDIVEDASGRVKFN